jgi:hypothetical protein
MKLKDLKRAFFQELRKRIEVIGEDPLVNLKTIANLQDTLRFIDKAVTCIHKINPNDKIFIELDPNNSYGIKVVDNQVIVIGVKDVDFLLSFDGEIKLQSNYLQTTSIDRIIMDLALKKEEHIENTEVPDEEVIALGFIQYLEKSVPRFNLKDIYNHKIPYKDVIELCKMGAELYKQGKHDSASIVTMAELLTGCTLNRDGIADKLKAAVCDIKQLEDSFDEIDIPF